MNNYIYPIITSWSDFKTKVANRKMSPQWYEYNPGTGGGNKQYRLYAPDSFLMFQWTLEQDGGADVTDFEDNYKDDWNAKLEYRDDNGFVRVHTSPRPYSNVTYFSGAGDNVGVGDGSKLVFSLAAGDPSRSVTITYAEDVYIKDGIIITEGAPLGSSVDIEVLNSSDVLQSRYGEKILLLGDRRVDINSEDSALIPSGYKVKVTVNNSDGTGDEDAAAAFKVCGILEMYRETTV